MSARAAYLTLTAAVLLGAGDATSRPAAPAPQDRASRYLLR
jgi:hypothetical protein